LRGFAFLSKIATIGYVVPGAIIGIGIISSSQSIVDFFAHTFQLKVGYLFYGGSMVLVYAYVFRFLAVAYNPLEANSLKLGKNLAESAYLLGQKRFTTLVNIELPLLKTTVVSSFLLVFIDTLKELPLTLILKPYELNTLAVTAYAYADDERVAEAALPALMIIGAVGLVLFFVNYKWKK
ncbi:MAG: ABC transporter permease subunit, partial [Bacteroidota bacterium]